MREFKYTVKENDCEKPIKNLLSSAFRFSSRFRTKIKKDKLVYLNGTPVAGWIIPSPGDILSVRLPDESSDFTPQDIPVNVVMEDQDLLIIDKQPGIVVHPTKGHPTGTLANGIMLHMKNKGEEYKIRFVNRLDMDTSGLVIVSKNSYCQNDFMLQSQNGNVEKTYFTLVKGIIDEESGVIDLPIGKPDPENVKRGVIATGAPSVTHYRVLERFSKGYTFLKVNLETGRTHQIRVHLSHIGHPVAGDDLYGGSAPWIISRQALHAGSLKFLHPVNRKPVYVTSPVPPDLAGALESLRS